MGHKHHQTSVEEQQATIALELQEKGLSPAAFLAKSFSADQLQICLDDLFQNYSTSPVTPARAEWLQAALQTSLGVKCGVRYSNDGALTALLAFMDDGTTIVSYGPVELTPSSDPINHPSHYTKQGAIECIDAIESALGRDGFVAFLKGQVFKYTWRAGHKDDAVADVSKAQWYMARLKKTLEGPVSA